MKDQFKKLWKLNEGTVSVSPHLLDLRNKITGNDIPIMGFRGTMNPETKKIEVLSFDILPADICGGSRLQIPSRNNVDVFLNDLKITKK